jgi:hypothetical protein
MCTQETRITNANESSPIVRVGYAFKLIGHGERELCGTESMVNQLNLVSDARDGRARLLAFA